jgi:DNA-binding NarL/FixJ family response regulator
MEKIRIAMADDHSVVREATCRALGQYPDFEIVGEAADGEQALELVKRVQPDILLVDIRMPVVDGIEVVRRIREYSAGTKALVLSAYEDEEYVMASLKAGASGYLLKTIDLNELAQSIRTVHLGQAVFHPLIAARIASAHEQRHPAAHQMDRLSPREREILGLAASGLDNNVIASRLELSVRTVEGHLSRIYGKLGVSSRAEAMDLASSTPSPSGKTPQ